MLDGFAYHRIVLDENGIPIDYIFLDVNPAYEEFTGLRRAEIVGKRVTEVLPGIERSEFDRIEAYGQVALTGEQMAFEQYSERTGRWSKVRAYSPRVGYFVTLIEDITDRKQAEEALRKLSRAVEQSPSTSLSQTSSGSIEYVNPRFTELTGYSREEAIGQNPRILKTDLTSPEEYKRMWTTIRSGGVWRGVFVNRKKNGDLYWEEASISPITNPSGEITHFVAVKQDITEQKAAEAERSRLLAELQDTNARLVEANMQAHSAADEAEKRAAELDTTISSMADGVVICGSQTGDHPDESIRRGHAGTDFEGTQSSTGRKMEGAWSRDRPGRADPCGRLPHLESLDGRDFDRRGDSGQWARRTTEMALRKCGAAVVRRREGGRRGRDVYRRY